MTKRKKVYNVKCSNGCSFKLHTDINSMPNICPFCSNKELIFICDECGEMTKSIQQGPKHYSDLMYCEKCCDDIIADICNH